MAMADELANWQERFAELIADAKAADLSDCEKDQLVAFIQDRAERITPVRHDAWRETGYQRR